MADRDVSCVPATDRVDADHELAVLSVLEDSSLERPRPSRFESKISIDHRSLAQGDPFFNIQSPNWLQAAESTSTRHHLWRSTCVSLVAGALVLAVLGAAAAIAVGHARAKHKKLLEFLRHYRYSTNATYEMTDNPDSNGTRTTTVHYVDFVPVARTLMGGVVNTSEAQLIALNL
ncbi:uncharacterized protein LOC144107797 [Amblyomma americanum]